MTISSKTTSASIRFLPRWLWWMAVAYTLTTIVTYIGALPIRYSNLIDIQGQQIAIIQTGIEYLNIVIVTVLGCLLLFRRSDEVIAVLLGLTIISGAPNLTGLSHLSTQLHPLFYIPSGIVLIFLSSGIFLCIIAMPDGYPKPKWAVWVIPPFLIFDTLRYLIFFVFGPPEIQELRPAIFFVNILVFVSGFIVMLWRYRYHASPIQKQQFKWLFFGISIHLCITGVLQVFRLIALRYGAHELFNTSLLGSISLTLSGIIMSSCVVFAISRYGLWDIDLTINRSTVATIVTIILAIGFAAVFFITQPLLRAILGTERGEIAVAISALAIGGVFNPVRLRVRTFVDRKLYGLRFDLNQLARHKEKAIITNPGALTGKILDGYELLDVIGHGGMGEVYKGYQDGQYVAVKILQTVHVHDEIMRRRFTKEGKIALEHSNIVHTISSGEQDGIFYIIMEYVEGQTLKDLLQERTRLGFGDIQDYLLDLAQAIDYAHTQGYIHRDIKPSNIMLCKNDDNETYRVVLMDFGIAKVLGDSASLTGSAAVGTIDYMAPEQIMDSTAVDYRADIYALGVVLYETLSGSVPFKGGLAQVLFAHINQPPPNIQSIQTDISYDVAVAIERALAKNPNDRFQSASEFIHALQSAV